MELGFGLVCCFHHELVDKSVMILLFNLTDELVENTITIWFINNLSTN